ncbi:glutamine--fructose-6-phosphate aminotransferase, partial [Candidatus Pacearchaeota archaeon]
MCGIVGYIGNKDVHTVILVGLEKLEYRGYDSAGIAIITDDGELFLRKKAGRYKDLYKLLDNNAILGKIGIGHTRWATHGKVNDENAHPMVDCKNKIALVHNGIIENYQELKKSLIQKGHKFASETDTEVIVHLIEEFYNEDKSLIKAVIKTVNKLKGSFALGIISVYEPDKIIGVRKDSPLLVGIGENEMVLASDLVPIVSITKNIIEME